MPTGRLFVVATPIGNLDDVSPRTIKVLSNCALIAAEDTRHTEKLLRHFGIRTRSVSYHKFNERERSEQIIGRIIAEGIDVALVSDAGTPCISDPGGEIVREARERGIPVFGVSGPSAIITALSISGLPAEEFTFVGFLPKKESARREVLERLKERGAPTFVLYESPKRVRAVARLIQAVFPEAKACFCSELTKLHEESYYGPIAQVAEALEKDPGAERGEYTVVVSNAAAAPARGGPAEGRSAGDQTSPGAGPISIEARLADTAVKQGLSLREAVAEVARRCALPRKEVYAASLRLKKVLGGRGVGRPDKDS